MTCALPLTLPAEATITYLEKRSSYMAKAPYIQKKPVKRKITDSAMYLSPVTWVGPTILRAHDAHEYKKDRRRMEAEYEGNQKSREKMARPQAGEGMAMRPPMPVPPLRTNSPTLTGRNSGLSARSESNLPRARALFWEGGSNLFSPGLLQPWSPVTATKRAEWDGEGSDSGYASFVQREDPWVLPPIEMNR